MTFYDQLSRIQRLDRMVHLHATGTPSELARKLNISNSQLYQTLRIMKHYLKAPIYYSRVNQSYCYEGSVRFICDFRPADSPEKSKIF